MKSSRIIHSAKINCNGMAIKCESNFLHGPHYVIESVTAVEGVWVADNHNGPYVVSISAHQIGFNSDAIDGF
jgi:hypothetical protein